MSTTHSNSNAAARAVAEQLLQIVDHKALSVADLAVAAGLPAGRIEQILHDQPHLLTPAEGERLAAAAGTSWAALADRAIRLAAADPREVVDGGQVVTVWHEQPADAAAVFLDQLLDVDPGAMLGREQVCNGSGREVGARYTLTVDGAEAVRAGVLGDGEPSTTCPSWCTWVHSPAEAEVTDVVMHETRVGQITLSTGEVVAAVVESTDDEPTPVVSFYDAENLTGLGADDLQALDQLLAAARDRLMQILASREG